MKFVHFTLPKLSQFTKNTTKNTPRQKSRDVFLFKTIQIIQNYLNRKGWVQVKISKQW